MGATKRLVRCKKCEPCTRDPCGTCGNCLDSPRFGGPNVRKQACKFKKCANPKPNGSGGAAEEEEKKPKKPVGRPAVGFKNHEYFQNIQNSIASSSIRSPPGPSSPLKRFENTSVNVSKITEPEDDHNRPAENGSNYIMSPHPPPSTPSKRLALLPGKVPTYPTQGSSQQKTPAKVPKYPHIATPAKNVFGGFVGPSNYQSSHSYPNPMIPNFKHNNARTATIFNPSKYFTPTESSKQFIAPPPKPSIQSNSYYSSSIGFKHPYPYTGATSSDPNNLQHDEPMNLKKKIKIDESQRAFLSSSRITSELKGDDNIINVDEMYGISDGIVDGGGLGADDITLEENDAGKEAGLLEKNSESLAVPPSLGESDELDETNLIRFLDKDDIISSFITIFEDASVEEKLSLFDRLMVPAGAAVQDRLMTQLFKTVQKRKHDKYEVKITEQVASEVLLKAKPPGPPGPLPPGPPGPPPGPLPQVARKSTSNSRYRNAMSLLVCDCRVYRTTNQEKLKNHIEAVHGGVTHHEWQTCGECDHRFKFWDDLKVHIDKNHKESKNQATRIL